MVAVEVVLVMTNNKKITRKYIIILVLNILLKHKCNTPKIHKIYEMNMFEFIY